MAAFWSLQRRGTRQPWLLAVGLLFAYALWCEFLALSVKNTLTWRVPIGGSNEIRCLLVAGQLLDIHF